MKNNMFQCSSSNRSRSRKCQKWATPATLVVRQPAYLSGVDQPDVDQLVVGADDPGPEVAVVPEDQVAAAHMQLPHSWGRSPQPVPGSEGQ